MESTQEMFTLLISPQVRIYTSLSPIYAVVLEPPAQFGRCGFFAFATFILQAAMLCIVADESGPLTTVLLFPALDLVVFTMPEPNTSTISLLRY